MARPAGERAAVGSFFWEKPTIYDGDQAKAARLIRPEWKECAEYSLEDARRAPNCADCRKMVRIRWLTRKPTPRTMRPLCWRNSPSSGMTTPRWNVPGWFVPEADLDERDKQITQVRQATHPQAEGQSCCVTLNEPLNGTGVNRMTPLWSLMEHRWHEC